jgi:hypothetical protein
MGPEHAGGPDFAYVRAWIGFVDVALIVDVLAQHRWPDNPPIAPG